MTKRACYNKTDNGNITTSITSTMRTKRYDLFWLVIPLTRLNESSAHMANLRLHFLPKNCRILESSSW